jgi:hypothetical protein
MLMVISIQIYVAPTTTTSSQVSASTSSCTISDPFQEWVKNTKRLACEARTFFVTVMVFNMIYAPLFSIIASFVFSPLSWQYAVILCVAVAVYATMTFLPKPEVTGAFDSSRARASFLVNDVMRYFNGRVVKTADLDATRQYIFGFHPHGIMPTTAMWAHNSETWKTLFTAPPRPTVTLIASHLFRIPFLRELLATTGAREVSRRAFERALREGKSVMLVPGGMREMRHSTSKTDEIVVCTTHKGFARMALVHGADLIPVFSFGETKLLDGAFPNLQRLCWRHIGLPFPLFVGRWGLPIPRKHPITVVVGAPIHVQKNPNPTQDDVDDLCNKYFASLRDIFELHKHQHGHASSTLILKDA